MVTLDRGGIMGILTEFFDKIDVDIRPDLSDWKSVRKELLLEGKLP